MVVQQLTEIRRLLSTVSQHAEGEATRFVVATPETIDRLSHEIVGLDRDALIRRLREMPCKFHLDFTDEFLESISLGRLRHIILAVCEGNIP